MWLLGWAVRIPITETDCFSWTTPLSSITEQYHGQALAERRGAELLDFTHLDPKRVAQSLNVSSFVSRGDWEAGKGVNMEEVPLEEQRALGRCVRPRVWERRGRCHPPSLSPTIIMITSNETSLIALSSSRLTFMSITPIPSRVEGVLQSYYLSPFIRKVVTAWLKVRTVD